MQVINTIIYKYIPNLGKEVQEHPGAMMQTLRYSVTVMRKGRDGLTGTKIIYQVSKE